MLLDVTQWAFNYLSLHLKRSNVAQSISKNSRAICAVAVGVQVSVCQHKCITLPNHTVISEATDGHYLQISSFFF